MSTKPKVAVFKFASCDGCQLTVLNLERDLLALAQEIDIAYFPEATSTMAPAPYDVALVEGSITTEHDLATLMRVREESKFLVTIGACSCTGGIQALRNWADVADYTKTVYATPDYIKTLAQSTPISAHVKVDFALGGCPIDRGQLVEVITSLLIGREPQLPSYPVCVDCKRNGNVCVLVAKGTACLGAVTKAGCGALCPSFARGCFGCFGPTAQPNTASLAATLTGLGTDAEKVSRLFRGFTGYAEAFRDASNKLEVKPL